MGWEVVFSPRSEDDLKKIVSYIAKDDRAAAIRFGETLISKARSACERSLGRRVLRHTRTLDQLIVKLRQKIEDEPTAPRHLLTVHTLGYRLEV